MASSIQTPVVPEPMQSHETLPPNAANGLEMTESDLKFWSNHCVPVLSSLLESTGSYTPEEQSSQLEFFKKHVLPTFGPRPANDDAQYLFMTNNGSPIELSINLSDVKPPQIRFSFTPVGHFDRVVQAVGADMTWFEQLAAEYFPSEEIAAKAKAVLPPNIPRVPSFLAALDLDGDKRAAKAYFGPMIKAVATGIPGNAGAIQSIKNLSPGGEGMVLALKMIEDFQKDGPEEPLLITMIGIDCVDPATARVKMYTRIGSNAFEAVRNVITLGGRRVDETTLKGLQILRVLWPILLNEDEASYSETVSRAELQPMSMHSGIMVTWELQFGKPIPDAKVYVPLFQFCNSNRAITGNMEKAFRRLGWAWGTEGNYRKAIENAFAYGGVYDKAEIVHSYCTFNFSKKGAYITSYIATPMGKTWTP